MFACSLSWNVILLSLTTFDHGKRGTVNHKDDPSFYYKFKDIKKAPLRTSLSKIDCLFHKKKKKKGMVQELLLYLTTFLC